MPVPARLPRTITLAAALALAACGGSKADEDLAATGLNADEVAGTMADGDWLPQPGRYRTTQELIAFDLPGMPESRMAMVRAAFAEGAAEPATFCLTEGMSGEQWLSQTAESNCTLSRLAVQGGRLDAAMSCAAADGITGEVTLSGTTAAEGSDLELRFTHNIPDLGDALIRMRLRSERIGDCG